MRYAIHNELPIMEMRKPPTALNGFVDKFRDNTIIKSSTDIEVFKKFS